jgi:fucose permease
LQTWNSPRSNLWRCLATFYSFVILGANDGAYGALIPYLETWYHVDYTIVSLIFLSPVVGYMSSALLNNHVHVVYGQRGVACIMSVSHVIAYTAICLHPPYPVLVVVFIVAGFGNGMGDSGWNAWIGDMANANEVLGFLHGFYGLGAAMSPLVATTLITQAGWRWYEFYYFMVGAAVIEVAVLVGCFWGATGEVYRAQHPQEPGEDDASDTTTPPEPELTSQATSPRGLLSKINPFGKRSHDTSPRRNKNKTLIAVKNRVTILSSLFLLAYVGVEVSLGGWTTTFMLRVRHGSAFGSGLTSTGFWLGIMVGRLVLGFVTGRLFQSEKHAVATYLGCSVVLELLFWLIPNFDSSAVMVGFLGFFLGPMFPAAVVALTKLLPKDLHVAAVGFAAAFGSSGACILPFVAGAIANAAGVKALQPVILAAVVLCLGVWLLIPKLPKQRMA